LQYGYQGNEVINDEVWPFWKNEKWGNLGVVGVEELKTQREERGERLVKWVIEWNSEKWMKIACFANSTFSLSQEYVA
jgi:hypothetical protein